MDERVMIFIDGSNFYHAMKEFTLRTPIPATAPFDYYRLSKLLVKKRKLIRTYYYTALHSESNELKRYAAQLGFLNHLRNTPYLSLRYGRLIRRGPTFIEKGVDVLLTVDLLRFARLNTYDTAIVVSGDGDYVEAIKDAQDMGKQVELAFLPLCLSPSVRTTADRFTEITATMIEICQTKPVPEMTKVNNDKATILTSHVFN